MDPRAKEHLYSVRGGTQGICLGIEQTWQHSLRNNQDMDRRLRVNVAKRNQVFFFQHNFSWNFTGDDFLENRHGLTKRAL